MDALVAVGAVAAFYLAFRRIGFWRYFWLGVAGYLGIFELAAKLITGKTLSGQYWAWADTSPWWWVPALLVALAGVGLGFHLVWRRLKR